MSEAEGIREWKLGTGLVLDLNLEAAEGGDEPELPHTCTEHGVHHAARGEGGSGSGIVSVYEHHDARRVDGNQVPQRDEEVDGLNFLARGRHDATCTRRPRRRWRARCDMEGRDIHLSHLEMTPSSLAAGMLMVISEESKYSPSQTTSTAEERHFSGARAMPSSVQMSMSKSKALRMSR